MKCFKQLFLFLVLSSFTPTLVIGQEPEKKVKYANVDGKYISEKGFNKCLKAGYLSKTVENEKTIVHYLSLNSYRGELTQTENKQIRLMLEKIISQEIDSNRTIVIHLYNKKDQQLIKDTNNQKYWSWIKKNPNRIEAFLIGNKDSGIIPNPENHIYVDSYNFFNKTFFNNSELDYNHLYIKPDGSYRLFLGKQDALKVLDFSV